MSVATPSNPPADISGGKVKKFLNGWTKEQEFLMAQWSDIAGCYRWLHDRSEKMQSKYNMLITLPVIVLSTLTGTANFAIDGFVEPGEVATKKNIQATIGGISIFAGILTTLGNQFKFAQLSESNRVAAIAWGKFQRLIAIELAIHPNDRMDSMDFLKICRQDLDRLIEQSPPIPDPIIYSFEKEFKDKTTLKKPDICHGLEHTRVFDSSDTRLTKLSAEAMLQLKMRKKVLRDDIVPDLDDIIAKKVEEGVQQRAVEIEAKFAHEKEELETRARTAAAMAASVIVSKATEQVVEESDWRRLLHTTSPTSTRNEIVITIPNEIEEETRAPSPPPNFESTFD